LSTFFTKTITFCNLIDINQAKRHTFRLIADETAEIHRFIGIKKAESA
jgi:hypothetical protein